MSQSQGTSITFHWQSHMWVDSQVATLFSSNDLVSICSESCSRSSSLDPCAAQTLSLSSGFAAAFHATLLSFIYFVSEESWTHFRKPRRWCSRQEWHGSHWGWFPCRNQRRLRSCRESDNMMNHQIKELRLWEKISIIPPCPTDDINNSTVGVVLVLQAGPHYLIRVRRGHGKYFG